MAVKSTAGILAILFVFGCIGLFVASRTGSSASSIASSPELAPSTASLTEQGVTPFRIARNGSCPSAYQVKALSMVKKGRVYVVPLDDIYREIQAEFCYVDESSAIADKYKHYAQEEVQPTVVREATKLPMPVSAPTATAVPVKTATVVNGGNFRLEPQIGAETVIGQVCPGDKMSIAEEKLVQGTYWYRGVLVSQATNCDLHRVQVSTEGWVSGYLLRIDE